MESINFPVLFDRFIVAPVLEVSNMTEGFKDDENRREVYTVFNPHFEPLYIDSSKDVKRRSFT